MEFLEVKKKNLCPSAKADGKEYWHIYFLQPILCRFALANGLQINKNNK
jgi:hypothetical protein